VATQREQHYKELLQLEKERHAQEMSDARALVKHAHSIALHSIA
jgi:hypothetical protein